MDDVAVSVVIPNYNGADLLRMYLPSVVAAVGHDLASEIIVVDDASPDDSTEVICNEFPSIRLIALEHNVGFGEACMTGVRNSRGDIVVMLNTDVEVTPDFIQPLIERFAGPQVFSVSSIDLNRAGDFPFEVSCFRWRRGFIVPNECKRPGDAPFLAAFTRGGYAAYRKSMFLELGGYDPIYAPFYWEDVDICYRAWKRGWASLVEPRSKVLHHKPGSAIRSNFRRRQVKAVYRRNKFLFTWANLTSRGKYTRHWASLLAQLAWRWLILDIGFYSAFYKALERFGQARKRSQHDLLHQTRTDQEVLGLLRPGENKLQEAIE